MKCFQKYFWTILTNQRLYFLYLYAILSNSCRSIEILKLNWCRSFGVLKFGLFLFKLSGSTDPFCSQIIKPTNKKLFPNSHQWRYRKSIDFAVHLLQILSSPSFIVLRSKSVKASTVYTMGIWIANCLLSRSWGFVRSSNAECVVCTSISKPGKIVCKPVKYQQVEYSLMLYHGTRASE